MLGGGHKHYNIDKDFNYKYRPNSFPLSTIHYHSSKKPCSEDCPLLIKGSRDLTTTLSNHNISHIETVISFLYSRHSSEN
ncbi:hypothetical protein SOVF_021890 [Spinacia oleracea]|nr:hypothetical protein SOVF_021890 [Spinacia oleracea]